MAILVVYSLRHVSLSNGWYEMIAVGIAVITHALRRNTILSISLSTIVYMLLVQLG